MSEPLHQRPDDDSFVEDFRLAGETDGILANRLLDSLMRQMGFEAADVVGGSMTLQSRSEFILSVCHACHDLSSAQKVSQMRVLIATRLMQGHVRRCIEAYALFNNEIRLLIESEGVSLVRVVNDLYDGPIGKTLLGIVQRTQYKLNSSAVVLEILSILAAHRPTSSSK